MLSPYRVLDLTDERGLIGGMILADLGADVIAIEPPGGSPARRYGPFAGDIPGPENSLYWWSYARGKRSVTLDLTDAGDRDRFRALARDADFVIESFEPGYLDGLGLGYHDLAAINPRLVMTSISAFGRTGPKAGWKATDLTVIAAAGPLLLTGDEDRPPVRTVVPQAFLHAGAEAATGSLIAHIARERDGRGQHIDVSAQQAAMMATQSMVLQHGWGENPLHRVAGGVKLGPINLQFIHRCKDGYVSITFVFGTGLGIFARRLMEWMCEEGFVDEATRDKDWLGYTVLLLSGQEPISELERVKAAIVRFALAHTKEELYQGAMQRGVLIVPVSTTEDIVHSTQLAARDYWTPVTQNGEGQTILYPGPFAKLSATPIRYGRPAPKIGEHNAEVLGAVESPASRVQRQGSTAVSALSTQHSALPLKGVKILDFTWVMVGPAGVRYLADYGATVVHVESATRIDAARSIQPFKDAQSGPERSGLYANVNAGKLGITLNLSTPEARAVAMRLVAWADVVVEAYTPKAMRAWGMTYEKLKEVNPDLIMLSTSLNGQTGPECLLAGFGTMGAALAGFGMLAGWPDRDPAGPLGAYTDYVAPKFIASSILAALDHRRRTGEGQFIDLSQAESSAHFLSPALLDYTVNGRVTGRAGNFSAEHAPHGVYPAAGDDRWVAIACEDDAQWHALCRAAGHPEWSEDPRFATFKKRVANHEALDATVGAWTMTLDVDAIETLLSAAGVPVHRVASSTDAFADPQLAAREHFVWVDHAELGRIPLESSRMRFSATPAKPLTPAPTFGEHNDLILRDILGMNDEEIVELVSSGALE